MDRHLERLIRGALAESRQAGDDHLTQTEKAVRVVLLSYPNMTAPDAWLRCGRCSGNSPSSALSWPLTGIAGAGGLVPRGREERVGGPLLP